MVFRYARKGMTAIGDWLRKLGACPEALPEFENASGIATGYASIRRPDWLLWFCFAQSTDVTEQKRVLGALLTFMSDPIRKALAHQATLLAPAAVALDDVSKFVKSQPLDHNELHGHHNALLGLAGAPKEKDAVDCARTLLALCLTQAGRAFRRRECRSGDQVDELLRDQGRRRFSRAHEEAPRGRRLRQQVGPADLGSRPQPSIGGGPSSPPS